MVYISLIFIFDDKYACTRQIRLEITLMVQSKMAQFAILQIYADNKK